MADIEHSILLSWPLERVWTAITDSSQFGSWFGADWDGPFEAGRTTTGRVAATTVDPEIAASQEPYVGQPASVDVIALDPMTRFAYRWTPVPDDPGLTTVEFTLAEQADGVLVTVTEDGFDALAAPVRDESRTSHDGGWEAQTHLLAGYLRREG
jgi:uncharacterized protein YndB with AHSA1/START domain